MRGPYFEEFEPGTVYRHPLTRTVDQDDVLVRLCKRTGLMMTGPAGTDTTRESDG